MQRLQGSNARTKQLSGCKLAFFLTTIHVWPNKVSNESTFLHNT
jgi:hypothetical protein